MREYRHCFLPVLLLACLDKRNENLYCTLKTSLHKQKDCEATLIKPLYDEQEEGKCWKYGNKEDARLWLKIGCYISYFPDATFFHFQLIHAGKGSVSSSSASLSSSCSSPRNPITRTISLTRTPSVFYTVSCSNPLKKGLHLSQKYQFF